MALFLHTILFCPSIILNEGVLCRFLMQCQYKCSTSQLWNCVNFGLTFVSFHDRAKDTQFAGMFLEPS
ncbi:hypothetical protein XENTR_v10014779 [Xenopus tropicalis]|nr:hypothetical protein XENTR_v10014779 [Xenopus tropicalis]